jgi:transcriptional regulator with XRE-family HTH domain
MAMVYDFGLRLKSLREKRNLSQSDVAARLEVTRSTISGYECNTITPSVEQLVKLALLYNTSLDYMMGLENRYHLYLDDLSESQQQAILDIVERIKLEFQK